MTTELQASGGAAALDYSDDSATFGDRLALAREASDLSQAQLSHRMGIKLQTLRNWEEDRAEPRANRLQMLAGMLNVSMVWLITGRGPAPDAREGNSETLTDRTCLDEVRALRGEHVRMAERLARLEKRLRTAME